MSVEQATRVGQQITAEQFAEMPEDPGKRYELVRGVVIEVTGAALTHAQIGRALFRSLDTFVIAHNLGDVFPDGLGYIIQRGPDTVRVPDVSFIAQGRIPPGGVDGFVPFAPDLAVEVVSTNDRAVEVYDKVGQYLAAGVRQVWVLWPGSQTVSVYRKEGTAPDLHATDVLNGGDNPARFSSARG